MKENESKEIDKILKTAGFSWYERKRYITKIAKQARLNPKRHRRIEE
jgi:hypothetical protein